MAASGIPYAWHLYKGTLNETLHDAHKKYGEVIRLTPTELSFTSGDTAWQDIYGFRSSKDNKVPYLKDMDWYNIRMTTFLHIVWQRVCSSILAPNGVPAIVAAPTVAYHTRHRRLLAHAFSDKALREQEYLLQQYVDLLIFRLGEQCEGKDRGMVDMVKWYNFTTFDIMGDLSFGESFHALDSRDYHPFIAMIYKGAARAIGFNLIMRRYPIIKKLSTLLGTGAPEEIRKQLFAFAFRQVDKRMELVTTRPDFMMYAQRHAGEEGQGLSRDELHSDMFIIIGAGSETTATTLAGATYMLSKHPEKLKRLQNEIRSTFKSQDEITIDAVNNLTYLIACLSEGLRLYPPVPTGFPRKVPPGGDTISGHQIAGGVR